MGRASASLAGLLREILGGAWRDGAVHAGNLAYLSLVTLFPAAILVTAVTGLAGRSEAGSYAISAFIAMLPPAVGEVIGPLVHDVVTGRSRGALGLSAVVALWTVSGFLDTVRGIILKAHGIEDDRPFWKTRLLLTVGTLAASASVLLLVAIGLLLTLAGSLLSALELGALVPPLGWLAPTCLAFAALWVLFAGLTPRTAPRGPRWPGALLVTLLWSLAALLLGPIVGSTGGMARTYGALAGVMLALLFFYGIGFAIVLGAETNAALARRRLAGLDAESDKGIRA